jgi:hypothetical protein
MLQTFQNYFESQKEDQTRDWNSEFKSSALLVFEIYYCRFPKRSYLIFKTREKIRVRTVGD